MTIGCLDLLDCTWPSCNCRFVGIAAQEPANEAEHFYLCEACGQAVDKRDLRSVFHHERAEHIPMVVS